MNTDRFHNIIVFTVHILKALIYNIFIDVCIINSNSAILLACDEIMGVKYC